MTHLSLLFVRPHTPSSRRQQQLPRMVFTCDGDEEDDDNSDGWFAGEDEDREASEKQQAQVSERAALRRGRARPGRGRRRVFKPGDIRGVVFSLLLRHHEHVRSRSWEGRRGGANDGSDSSCLFAWYGQCGEVDRCTGDTPAPCVLSTRITATEAKPVLGERGREGPKGQARLLPASIVDACGGCIHPAYFVGCARQRVMGCDSANVDAATTAPPAATAAAAAAAYLLPPFSPVPRKLRSTSCSRPGSSSTT